jgi:hypothetical protein
MQPVEAVVIAAIAAATVVAVAGVLAPSRRFALSPARAQSGHEPKSAPSSPPTFTMSCFRN